MVHYNEILTATIYPKAHKQAFENITTILSISWLCFLCQGWEKHLTDSMTIRTEIIMVRKKFSRIGWLGFIIGMLKKKTLSLIEKKQWTKAFYEIHAWTEVYTYEYVLLNLSPLR